MLLKLREHSNNQTLFLDLFYQDLNLKQLFFFDYFLKSSYLFIICNKWLEHWIQLLLKRLWLTFFLLLNDASKGICDKISFDYAVFECFKMFVLSITELFSFFKPLRLHMHVHSPHLLQLFAIIFMVMIKIVCKKLSFYDVRNFLEFVIFLKWFQFSCTMLSTQST